MSEPKRKGPTVRVEVKYECNGCQYHGVGSEEGSAIKYHTCSHPQVLKEYEVPQFMGTGREGLTIYHPCPTSVYLCPYTPHAREGKS